MSWRKGFPDDEITVLLRTNNQCEPIWLGYHDGDHGWRWANGERVVDDKVLGWMHLEEAALILDRSKPIKK